MVCINITVETHLVPNGFANLFLRRTISSIKTQTNVTINDYIVLFLWYKCNYLWQDETLKLKLYKIPESLKKNNVSNIKNSKETN